MPAHLAAMAMLSDIVDLIRNLATRSSLKVSKPRRDGIVKELRIDQVQGYYVGRPAAIENAETQQGALSAAHGSHPPDLIRQESARCQKTGDDLAGFYEFLQQLRATGLLLLRVQITRNHSSRQRPVPHIHRVHMMMIDRLPT